MVISKISSKIVYQYKIDTSILYPDEYQFYIGKILHTDHARVSGIKPSSVFRSLNAHFKFVS